MATIIEYYEVMYNSGFELGGAYAIARFATLAAAEEYAKLDRFRFVSKTKRKLVVYDNLKEMELQRRADLREEALKKLTDEERLVLGV